MLSHEFAPSSSHDVYQAIADPSRRMIMRLLAGKEMPIAAIKECLPITRTAVNKHLHVLAEAGLVSYRKVGRETRYELHPDPLVELREWLAFFEQYWDDKLTVLKGIVEADTDKT